MKERFEIVLNADFKDLNPIYFGCTYTGNGFNNGPRIKMFSNIAYVIEGSADLIINGTKYEIKSGDIIIETEGNNVHLKVHSGKIFNSIYIGFDGDLSLSFASLQPVFAGSPELFEELYNIRYLKAQKAAATASWLFKFYSIYVPSKSQTPFDYVSRLKDYIDNNYYSSLCVSDLAKSFNLNPSYLSRIFKQQTGTTIQNYILTKRLKQAKLLLNNEGKNVTEAAFLCGFNSSTHFSKMYKKYYGHAPKTQKNIKNDK